MKKTKAENISNNFLKINKPIILSLTSPFKSKICLFSDPLVYVEIYLQNIYSQEILKEGMTILDIGAHIGNYTILAAEKVGEKGKVIAIEPHPQNYQWLLENIKLNNFQNVIPLNIALSDKNGFGKLYLHSQSGCYSLIPNTQEKSYISVPLKTVDKLIEELKIKKIDLMKIDTEGSELKILKGAEKTLDFNPNIKLIVASYHYPTEIKEVSQFLISKGFKIKVSSEGIITTL